MPDTLTVVRKMPDPIDPFELFPGLDHEINSRMQMVEYRIKNWVIAGVLANTFVALCAGIPMVYYLGQQSKVLEDSAKAIETTNDELGKRARWMEQRNLWESSAESWMEQQGYRPPRQLTDRDR